ncbi:MAG: BMP family ABC transporter substrate-binding protein [Oscillospiraceae bacterium]
MKKILALVLAMVMMLTVMAGCSNNDEPVNDESESQGEVVNNEGEDNSEAEVAVAMVTDYGDITDQSFNQTTYEACKEFCEANNLVFEYFKPASDSDEDRVAQIENAIDKGYNVIVMPGFAFANAIKATADVYPEVTFVALDVSAGDLGDDYTVPANLYCAVYQEELCGYMAGYAAVKLGYTKLGFLGGMAVPAVVRYGYGFIQGADAAAAETGAAVEINYAYGNQFYGDADITAAMDTWYGAGTEVVFACGGSIYTSAAEAAAKANAKVIGVDVDQSGIIDGGYGEGMTVTSAMKGLAPTVKDVLTKIVAGEFEGGQVATLGLVSENPEDNYVQIPMTTQFDDNFTADDYKALVAAMYAGDIVVSNDTTISAADNATVVTVNDLGNIK